MPVARPVVSSAATMTPFKRGFSVAVSKRCGSRSVVEAAKKPMIATRSTPMIESCGPVMPTSVM